MLRKNIYKQAGILNIVIETLKNKIVFTQIIL